MSKLNILFLTISRIENIYERGIYTDLLREFTKQGHHVYVVSPLERRFGKNTFLIEHPNCTILKVKTLNLQKTNFIEKGIGTVLMENQFNKQINNHFKKIKFDLILYSTPPITLTKIIDRIKKRDNCKSYLLLKDIFPQNAVDLELISKKSPLYYFFRKKEEKLYKLSDHIGCMSPANVKYLLDHNPDINLNKVEICPNSIEIQEGNFSLNKIDIRNKYSIPEDATVYIYGGNLGKPQGVHFIIDVLNSNIGKKDRFFIIAGSGTEFGVLYKWFEETKTDNVILLKSLPKQEYDNLVKSCDVGLIFLDPRFTIPNYPSRLLSYMENRMPVLMATDTNTDIGKNAQENGYGLWCKSGNLIEFNNLLDRLSSNPDLIKQMGTNAHKFLVENYLVSITADIILSKTNKNTK